MTGYSAGINGTILRTKNAGVNWNAQSISAAAELQEILFLNENTGWVFGGRGLLQRLQMAESIG